MHDLVGHLRPGRLHGDVDVRGHTFSVEDVEAVWLRRPPAPPRRRRLDLRFAQRLRDGLSGAV